MSQQFCLKWNNHMNNMMDVFKNLLSTESMVDVTLACDGLSLKAHKMVLSACSPFFQSLFLENPCKHPIVILKDMKYSELKAIIEFMYHGEVNVAQDQLSALMKTAETLRVKGLAEVTNEKNTSSSAQDEPGHRSVPRTETPPPQSKRRRGRVRKRSLSDSNRSDDSNEPKIKQPVSPDIEELSGDITMDNSSGQFSNLQSQVPMQSLPSHSTNSYHKSSSVVSLDPQIEEPASADESEFGVEPAKLLEQTLTTDDLSNRRSGRTSTMASGMEMSRRPRASTDHSSLVPSSMPSESMMSNQPPESPPDIKPELLELEPPMSPVAGPSHSTDNSMMMYMDQSSVSSHPGTSYQDNQALVSQDSQPQDLYYCDKCDRVFTSRDVLATHKKRHRSDTTEKRHRCPLCPYATNYSSHLRQHTFTHSGERPFKCTRCTAGFTQNSLLKKHMLVHEQDEDSTKNSHGKKVSMAKEETTKNDRCSKDLNTVNEKKQQKQSTPETLIKPCTKCSKTFNEDKQLQKHMRMHKRREKPHKCKVCNKRFSAASNLTRHEKKHSKEEVTSNELKSSKTRKEKKPDVSTRKNVSSGEKVKLSGKTDKCHQKEYRTQLLPHSEETTSPHNQSESSSDTGQQESKTSLCNRISPIDGRKTSFREVAESEESSSDEDARSSEEDGTLQSKDKSTPPDKTSETKLDSQKRNDNKAVHPSSEN